MMNKKQGSMGINTIVYIILAGVFLFVVLGIFTGSFGSLREQLTEKFNWVQILIGVKEDVGGCSERRETISDVATGVVVACADSCTFNSDSEVFLGANKFMISNDGFKAWSIKDEEWINVNSWGNDLEESEKHRDAYKELKKVSDEFYEINGNGKSREEFFAPMEFDSAGTLEYILNGFRDVVFRWDGERWEKIIGEYETYHDDAEVLKEIYDWYKNGKEVFWHYRGDGKLNTPMSEFNKNFKNELYSEKEYKRWFNDKVKETIDFENKNVGFYIEIEKFLFNTVYVFKDNSWSRSRLLWDNHYGHEDVFNKIYEAHFNEKEITWHFSGDKINRVPVSDMEIVPRKIFNEKEFREWFNEKMNNWTNENDAQLALVSDFSDFLDNEGIIYFEEEDRGVKMAWRYYNYKRTINYGPVIYFENSNNEKFGLYYEKGIAFLAYGDLFKGSIVNDVVGFSDSEWEEFVKINKIYGYLSRKCGE